MSQNSVNTTAIDTIVDAIMSLDSHTASAINDAVAARFRNLNPHDDMTSRAKFESGYALAQAMDDINRIIAAHDRDSAPGVPETATVEIMKESGKYYETQQWRIPVKPDGTIGIIYPQEMNTSPDAQFREGFTVVVPEQYPWGYPAVLSAPDVPATNAAANPAPPEQIALQKSLRAVISYTKSAIADFENRDKYHAVCTLRNYVTTIKQLEQAVLDPTTNTVNKAAIKEVREWLLASAAVAQADHEFEKAQLMRSFDVYVKTAAAMLN